MDLFYQCGNHPVMTGRINIVSGATSAGTFVIEVATKDEAHPGFGQPGGISLGYVVDGVQGKPITVTKGSTYEFDTSAVACNHPVYITTDEAGGFADSNTDNADSKAIGFGTNGVSSEGTPSNGGICKDNGPLYWTPTASQVGNTYYYQCSLHRWMGSSITVVDETTCEFYANALSKTQTELMGEAIDQVLGVITTDPILESFFTNPPAGLRDSLVAFFGAALGCNDPAFPDYTGATDMRAVHKDMVIALAEFNQFNDDVEQGLLNYGMSAADAGAVKDLLDTFKGTICNQGDCENSFCDVYTKVLRTTNTYEDQEAVIATVVDATVTELVANGSPVKKYFDGTIGEVNFLEDSAQLALLRSKLIAMFAEALGCSQFSSDQLYDIPGNLNTFVAVHQNLQINKAESNYFNNAIIDVLASVGVSGPDQQLVLSVLQSLDEAVIYQVADAPPTAPPAPAIQIEKTYAVTTGSKTDANPWANEGFPVAYFLDGDEAPVLNLQVGLNYVFESTAGCNHPFYITTSDVGAGFDEVIAGTSSDDYTQVCGGNNPLTFTPTQAQFDAQAGGTTYYYNCRVHSKMGGVINICEDAADCASSNAPTPTNNSPSSDTPSPTNNSPSPDDGPSPSPSEEETSAFRVGASLVILAAFAIFF
jgi:plastocyanin